MNAMRLFVSTMEPEWSTLLEQSRPDAAEFVRFIYWQNLLARTKPMTERQERWVREYALTERDEP